MICLPTTPTLQAIPRYCSIDTGRLVLKKKPFFSVGEYAEYGFDQQRLMWYVFRLWDMVFS